MGAWMNVMGIMPASDEYKTKAEVWRACKAAGVDVPKEVNRFFDEQEPEPDGMVVELRPICEPWTDGDMREGYEIDLAKLPEGVTRICVYMSY